MPLNLIYTNADIFMNTILAFSYIYDFFLMSYSSFDLFHTDLSLGELGKFNLQKKEKRIFYRKITAFHLLQEYLFVLRTYVLPAMFCIIYTKSC